MTPFRTILLALLLFTSSDLLAAEETDDASQDTIQFPSPDGRFAFRYSGGKSEDDKRTYDLIEKASGKVVKTVAKSDPNLGPSGRFAMEEVQWRADSMAFALTALLWKRGTSLFVFVRNGSTFREIKLPDLAAVIRPSAKKGKDFSHVNQLDSEKAKGWQRDGSLLVEIETIVDGEGGTLTATRNVVLVFDRSNKAKIAQSTIKFAIEDQ